MSPIESACIRARLSTPKSIEVSFEFTVELRHSASFRVQAAGHMDNCEKHHPCTVRCMS